MKSKVRACPVKIRVRLQIATSITSVFMSCFVSKVGTWTTEFWIQLCMKYPLHSFLSHVYMCALVVCGGMTCLCMYVCMCAYVCTACEGLRLTSAVFLVCVPTYSLKKSLLINPGLAPLPQPPGIYTDDGGLNSNPYTYTATTLSTELSLQSHFTIYFTLMGKSTNLSSYLLLQ